MKNYIWKLKINNDPEFEYFFLEKLSKKNLSKFIDLKDVPRENLYKQINDITAYDIDWEKVKIQDSKNFQILDNRKIY